MITPLQWRIFLADLEPAEGSEQGGTRPVLVVSNQDFNQVMPVVTVVPITSLKPGRRVYPSEVILKKGEGNLAADSLALAHQIRTISKKRLKRLLGFLSDADRQQGIKAAIMEHLELP